MRIIDVPIGTAVEVVSHNGAHSSNPTVTTGTLLAVAESGAWVFCGRPDRPLGTAIRTSKIVTVREAAAAPVSSMQ